MVFNESPINFKLSVLVDLWLRIKHSQLLYQFREVVTFFLVHDETGYAILVIDQLRDRIAQVLVSFLDLHELLSSDDFTFFLAQTDNLLLVALLFVWMSEPTQAPVLLVNVFSRCIVGHV